MFEAHLKFIMMPLRSMTYCIHFSRISILDSETVLLKFINLWNNLKQMRII